MNWSGITSQFGKKCIRRPGWRETPLELRLAHPNFVDTRDIKKYRLFFRQDALENNNEIEHGSESDNLGHISSFSKLLTDWLAAAAASLSANLPLPLENRTGGRSVGRSVGCRRCPFPFRVPIPCLNNLDIYKQTAAASPRKRARGS